MEWDLEYWKSDDWKIITERLDKLEKDHVIINPTRSNMFSCLRNVDYNDVRVCIMGQDPYPDPRFATGVAFSIPRRYPASEFPRTLRQIFDEYKRDLRAEYPSHGDLSEWEKQGVLLWNAIPSIECGRSLSHNWSEYHNLTKEIVQKLSKRGIVFVFLGAIAGQYEQYITANNNVSIRLSHPSPRGFASSKHPFKWSRMFTTINDKLVNHGLEPIDWILKNK